MTPLAALMRALRGPLMLVALGALMQAHRSWDLPFTKTWPVLLILFGLMKLLERLAQRTMAEDAR
jgi:hypothetical protein